MSVELIAGLCSIGAFILGVTLPMLAMRRRDKAERAAILAEAKEYVKDEFKDHWRAEHMRDSESRTVRERVGLLEVRCKERHE